MICASRPNFYKANSSLSEIFLHVSLNDLWLPSQFLQHNLIIKWNTPHMLRFLIVWSAPIFIDAAAIGWKFHVRGHMPALHAWRISWWLQSGCAQLACTFGADLSTRSSDCDGALAFVLSGSVQQSFGEPSLGEGSGGGSGFWRGGARGA